MVKYSDHNDIMKALDKNHEKVCDMYSSTSRQLVDSIDRRFDKYEADFDFLIRKIADIKRIIDNVAIIEGVGLLIVASLQMGTIMLQIG